jgi:pimeloyl-ACP methyl ester carboxylesterase
MSPIPVWNETRAGLEAAALLGSATWREADGLDGQGQAVLLVPGFLASDRSLGLMTQWLRRGGYWTRSAGIRTNADCAGATLTALEERLEALVDARGPAVLIGQSRGGNLARALAVRRPDLAAALITLGSPHLDPLAVGRLTLLSVRAVGTLGTLGVPGLISRDCLDGECCVEFHAARTAPWPGHVPFVSIYSRRDGIVDWRVCLDEGAEHVEVGASHIGMAAHVGTYKAIADALRSIDPPADLARAA